MCKCYFLAAVIVGILWGAGAVPAVASEPIVKSGEIPTMEARVKQYATVRLTADLSSLTTNERRMIPLLIEAAQQMDEVFWLQAYGDREAVLAAARGGDERKFLEINYGPWDRLAGNEPFVEGVGPKAPGANFYPSDMTKEEFEKHLADRPEDAERFRSEYTAIVRSRDGGLTAAPYHGHWDALYQSYVYRRLKARGDVTEREGAEGGTRVVATEAARKQLDGARPIARAAALLDQAAELAEDAGLKKYLELRAKALRTDDYRPSDMAWLDMKNNTVDVVIGPIETYEDRLFGYKAAHEAFVLIKDRAWSERLAKYAAMLPGLQRGLPVPDAYKQEMPGSDSDLNAYDVIYYAGDCNAGSKTIAINLPNDEQVQLAKGTRRLQLKNAMRAKYDKILVPIAGVLIAEDQRQHVTFDAFFANTMFHEVAHGLGIKNTINGRGTVREALRDQYSALEEGKADILGLYMVTKLYEQGELTGGSLLDNYVTFMAGIFRSVRFGASSAHGRANMLRFNYFAEAGAFSRDSQSGTYRVNVEALQSAMNSLAEAILRLQGDGDYEGVKKLMAEKGVIGPGLQADLDRLAGAGIPVDIVFEQGAAVLGLRG